MDQPESSDPSSSPAPGTFSRAAGLVLDQVSGTAVSGHIELGEAHHQPWGIVHGGVYASAVETAASVGASEAVRERSMVAVGLTNTTHFVRSISGGRVQVKARALHQGRSQQLWQVDIEDAQGKLVAHGELRLQNLPAQR